MRGIRAALGILLLTGAFGGARANGLVESLVKRFSESEFEFVRTESNAPFFPVAWLSGTVYQQSEFNRDGSGGPPITFEQSSVAQAAFLPLPIGTRDAFVIGEWLSVTEFQFESVARADLDVFSAAVPIGWIQQSTPHWQVAAFVAPVGHTTRDDNWYWEALGGAFARYTVTGRSAWILGAYFDVSSFEEFYTPYLGATFILNERWSINAVMPWPSVTYAPSINTVFRLGVVPSGASWTIEADQRRPRMSLTAWNFGLSWERRVYKNIWCGFELGVSAIRGLSIVDGDWQSLDTKLDGTGYGFLTVNLRPGSLRER
jgi:hypothetical protein